MKWAWLWLGLAITACGEPESGAPRGQYPAGTGGQGAADAGGGGVVCGELICHPNARCEGTGEDLGCRCLDGYEGDGVECSDVDECEAGTHDCDSNADCENRAGGFACECKPGFSGDGRTCSSVDECSGASNTCDPNAVCIEEASGFGCQCDPDFVGLGEDGEPAAMGQHAACADLDECADEALYSCAQNAVCENTFGGFECKCPAGFSGDGDVACAPLCDLARVNRDVCAEQGACRVTGTEAVCDACEPGFTGDGVTCTAAACDAACDGVGEDADDVVCTAEGTCACAPGFEGEPGSCTNIDECAEDPDRCGDNAECMDTPGGYLCACLPGFERTDTGECADVDECAGPVSPCHPDATCTNESPGFSCECREGFRGDGAVCFDIDECQTDNGGCGPPATNQCTNQRGGFECGCKAPLVGDAGACRCDLNGLWAMRQDVDTCWKARPIQEGSTTNLISAGSVEANVWELYEIRYDGTDVTIRSQGCGSDNEPDLISPVFQETYSSYVPESVFSLLGLQDPYSFEASQLRPESTFTTPSYAAVLGIDLGDDPLTAPWPVSHEVVDTWTDPDQDGEPGLTLWPRLPSETTDSMTRRYSYIPARPGIAGSNAFIAERAGCVSVALRVITHLEATVSSCTRIVGRVVNEKTEGRVHGCTLVEKGTCDPDDLNDCEGWREDITCDANTWGSATRCAAEDLARFDDDQNQAQNSKATFEMVRIADLDAAVTCADVRAALPPIPHNGSTITCTTPE